MPANIAFNLGIRKVITIPSMNIIISWALWPHLGCPIRLLFNIDQTVFAENSPTGIVESVGVLSGFIIPAADGLTRTSLFLKTSVGTLSFMTSKKEYFLKDPVAP